MRKTFLTKTTIFRTKPNLARELEILPELKRRAFYRLADEIPWGDGVRAVVTWEIIKTIPPEPEGFYYQANMEFDEDETIVEHPKTWREKLVAIFEVLW